MANSTEVSPQPMNTRHSRQRSRRHAPVKGETRGRPSRSRIILTIRVCINTTLAGLKTDTMPNVTSMQTAALWYVLSVAINPKLVELAPSVEDVFKYIIAHPALHRTKCRFTVNSDWGGVGLLSPPATIRPGPKSPAEKDITISTTKVLWGKEHSHKFKRNTSVE